MGRLNALPTNSKRIGAGRIILREEQMARQENQYQQQNTESEHNLKITSSKDNKSL